MLRVVAVAMRGGWKRQGPALRPEMARAPAAGAAAGRVSRVAVYPMKVGRRAADARVQCMARCVCGARRRAARPCWSLERHSTRLASWATDALW